MYCLYLYSLLDEFIFPIPYSIWNSLSELLSPNPVASCSKKDIILNMVQLQPNLISQLLPIMLEYRELQLNPNFLKLINGYNEQIYRVRVKGPGVHPRFYVNGSFYTEPITIDFTNNLTDSRVINAARNDVGSLAPYPGFGAWRFYLEDGKFNPNNNLASITWSHFVDAENDLEVFSSLTEGKRLPGATIRKGTDCTSQVILNLYEGNNTGLPSIISPYNLLTYLDFCVELSVKKLSIVPTYELSYATDNILRLIHELHSISLKANNIDLLLDSNPCELLYVIKNL